MVVVVWWWRWWCGGGGDGGGVVVEVVMWWRRRVALYPHCIPIVSLLYPHCIPPKRGVCNTISKLSPGLKDFWVQGFHHIT